jgi:hypothetical protein
MRWHIVISLGSWGSYDGHHPYCSLAWDETHFPADLCRVNVLGFDPLIPWPGRRLIRLRLCGAASDNKINFSSACAFHIYKLKMIWMIQSTVSCRPIWLCIARKLSIFVRFHPLDPVANLLDFPLTWRVGRPYFHFIGHFTSCLLNSTSLNKIGGSSFEVLPSTSGQHKWDVFFFSNVNSWNKKPQRRIYWNY